MKSYILIGIFSILLTSSTFAQQSIDINNPVELEKLKNDLEKVKTSFERSNTGPSLPNYSNPKEKSNLDKLIESLEPGNGPHMNTNPATTPVAPKGVYNTSAYSKINVDEGVFKPTAKESEKTL